MRVDAAIAASAQGLMRCHWGRDSRRRARWICGLLLLGAALGSRSVEAEVPTALERVHVLSASPETPRFALSYRGSLRASLGGELPVVGARGRSPYTLQVASLVELHNLPGSKVPLPNESWRGRLGIEAWRTRSTVAHPWEVGLAVEHESDHDTGRGSADPRFLGINDVALRGLVLFPLGLVALGVHADAKGLVRSCTRIATPCAGFEGTTTVGGALGLTADLRSGADRGWRPFLGVDLSGFVARGSVAAERRIAAEAGLWFATRGGLWQILALGWAGNDVGIRRTTTVGHAGVGVRYAFMP